MYFITPILNQFFKKELKGGALYIAIIVGIIIGIILTMFILLAKFNLRQVTVFAQTSQLHYNLRSALEIVKSDYFSESLNNRWIKNSLNDDSIKVKKLNWGAFLIVSIQTKNRHQSLFASGLYGAFMSSDTGLVVSDNSRPIGVSGNVIFKANCYLPSGIKPSYIEGNSYSGNSQNGNFIKKAPISIPKLDDLFIKGIKDQQAQTFIDLDSMVKTLPLIQKHSFSHRTITWEPNTSQLSGVRLMNNFKIISRGAITIDSSCRLDNILIICRKVTFKEGFKGSVHVIASDSILSEKNCVFQYPSSFVLSAEVSKNNSMKIIEFEPNCVFEGGIIAFRPTNLANSEGKVLVKLSANSLLRGLLYSSDYAHLEGILNSNIFCNSLLLKTSSGAYENQLLNCEIDPIKYAQLLFVPNIIKRSNNLMECKKLNN